MFKKLFIGFGVLFLSAVAYLLFWPVPIKPVAWNAPQSKGYTGQFSVNTKLANLDMLSIGDHHGPEDIDGRIENGQWIVYTSTQSGDIIRINTHDNTQSVFANTGGVALGLQFDAHGNLIIADAYKGLLSIDANGIVSLLTNTTDDGSPILYADEMAIAKDGKIYFSDASTKFGSKAAGSTLSGSILEIIEHGKTGRILVYNPHDKTTKTVMDKLSFSNGVAMCPDEDCILVVETGSYSVKRFWLNGPNKGTTDTIIENLPGFPDNLNRGQDGRYWLGLTSIRSEPIDKLSNKPFMRKIIMRLPKLMRPKAENYGLVLAIDFNGNLIAQYQDPTGAYPLTTGATELGDGWLYIGSLGALELGRKDLRGETF